MPDNVDRRRAANGPSLPLLKGKNRPILLKKSVMVSAAEKYAPDVEIFTFGCGFQTQISRSSVQKRRFYRSMIRQFWITDFFNRIGQKQSFMLASKGASHYDQVITQKELLEWIA